MRLLSRAQPSGQPGIGLEAFGAPALPVLFHEWKGGAAAGGPAAWEFPQLALGKSLQPDPAVAGALTGVRIQTFSPDLKAGGGPASPKPAFSP